jgi:predicted Zn-dependent protease
MRKIKIKRKEGVRRGGKRRGCAIAVACLFCAAAFAQDEAEVAARYEEMLAQAPDSGAAFDRVFQHYFERGELESLDARWKELSEGEDGGAYVLLRGRLAERQGDRRAALRLFAEAVERMPEDPRAWMARADAESSEGSLERALEGYRKAIDMGMRGEERMEAYRRIARVQKRLMKLEDAVATLRTMMGEFPGDVFVLEEAGETLIEAGRPAEAREVYEKLRDGAGADGFRRMNALLRLARIDEQTKGRDAAVAIYEEVLTESAETSWIQREARQRIEDLFRRQEDLSGLAEYYRGRLKKHSRDLDSASRLAGVLAQLGQEGEAVAVLEAAVGMASERRDLRERLAEALTAAGRHDEAIAALGRLARESGDAEAQERLGEAYWKRHESGKGAEDREAAIEAWKAMAPEAAEDAGRIARAAEVFARHELDDEAAVFFGRAVARRPESFDWRERWAEVLVKLGRREEAVAALGGGVEGELGTAENFRRLAGAARRMEFKREAYFAIESGLGLNPGDFELLALKARFLSDDQRWPEVSALMPALMEAAPGAHYLGDLEERYVEALANAAELDDRRERLWGRFEENAASEDEARLLARILRRDGDVERLREVLDRALEAFPRSVEVARLEMNFQRIHGKHDGQMRAVERLIEVDPIHRQEFLRDLAQIHADSGRRDAALEVAERRIALSPANAEGYLFYAELCLSGGQPAAGIAKLEEALRLTDRPNDARLRLARAYAEIGDVAAARQVQEDAFEYETRPEVKLGLMRTLAEYYQRDGRIDELVQRLKDRQRLAAGDAFNAYLAEVYLQTQDYGAARDELSRALAIRPRDAGLARQLLGLSQVEQDTTEALRFARLLAEIDPSIESRIELACALAEDGQLDEALALLKEIGPAALEAGWGFDEALDVVRSKGYDEQVNELLAELAARPETDWKARLLLAGDLIGRGEYARADAILKGLEKIADDEVKPVEEARAQRVGEAQNVVHVSGVGRIESEAIARMHRHANAGSQLVAWCEELPDRRASQRSRSTISGRSGGSSPRRVRLNELKDAGAVRVLRAHLAVLEGRGDAFLAEWKADAEARGLGATERMIELYALQAPRELLDAVRSVAEDGAASIEERRVALQAAGALNSRAKGIGEIEGLRKRLLDSLNLDEEETFESLAQRVYPLLQEDNRDEAAALVDRAFERLQRTDLRQLATAIGLCVGVKRYDEALELYAQGLAQAPSLHLTNPNTFGNVLGSGLFIGQAMLKEEGRKKQGMELIQSVLSLTYVRARGGARRGSGSTSNSSRYRQYDPSALERSAPYPNEWFDQNEKERLRQLHGQMLEAGVMGEFREALAGQAEAGTGDEAIFPRLALAYCDWWDGKPDEAVRAVRALEADFPAENFSMIVAAMLAASGRHDEAAALAEAAPPVGETRDETMARLLLGLAVATLKNDRELGKRLADRFEPLYPRSDERSFVASLLAGLELKTEAEAMRGSARQVPGKAPSISQRLEELESKEEDREKGVALARGVLRSGMPTLGRSSYNAARSSAVRFLDRRKELDAFAEEIRDELERNPGSVRLNALLVEALSFRRRKETVPYLEKLVKLRPGDVPLRTSLAEAYRAADRHEDAANVYADLLRANPAAVWNEARSGLLDTYKKTGRLKELAGQLAQSDAGAGVRRADRGSLRRFYEEVAKALESSGEGNAACEYYHRAIEYGGGDVQPEALQAYVRLADKEVAQADLLRRAEQLLFPGEAKQEGLLAWRSGGNIRQPWTSSSHYEDGRISTPELELLRLIEPKRLMPLMERAEKEVAQRPDDEKCRTTHIALRIFGRDSSVIGELSDAMKNPQEYRWPNRYILHGTTQEFAESAKGRTLALQLAIQERDGHAGQRSTSPSEVFARTLRIIELAVAAGKQDVGQSEMRKVLDRFVSMGAAMIRTAGSDRILPILEKALEMGEAAGALKVIEVVLAGTQSKDDTLRQRVAFIAPRVRLLAGEETPVRAVVWQSGAAESGRQTLSWWIGPAQSGPLGRPPYEPDGIGVLDLKAPALGGKYDLEVMAVSPPNDRKRIAMIPGAKAAGRWSGVVPDTAQFVYGVLHERKKTGAVYPGRFMPLARGGNLIVNPTIEPAAEGTTYPGWTAPGEVRRVANAGPDGKSEVCEVMAGDNGMLLRSDAFPLKADANYMQGGWFRFTGERDSRVRYGWLLEDESGRQVSRIWCTWEGDREGWIYQAMALTTRKTSEDGKFTAMSFARGADRATQARVFIEAFDEGTVQFTGLRLVEVAPEAVVDAEEECGM